MYDDVRYDVYVRRIITVPLSALALVMPPSAFHFPLVVPFTLSAATALSPMKVDDATPPTRRSQNYETNISVNNFLKTVVGVKNTKKLKKHAHSPADFHFYVPCY